MRNVAFHDILYLWLYNRLVDRELSKNFLVDPSQRQVGHPCCIAFDQKVCGWDGGHPGLTFWNLLNYTWIENAHEVCKNVFVFYYVAVICTITKRKKIRAYVSRYDQSVWNAISMTKFETKHRFATVLAQKQNGKLVMHHKIKEDGC